MLNRIVTLGLFLWVGLLAGGECHALEWGCQLRPAMIPVVGSRIIKRFNEQDRPFPDHVNLHTGLKLRIQSQADAGEERRGIDANGTVEGFYRPERDANYSYFPLPLFEFQLNRDRDVVYLCGHSDPDPKKSHVTMYILSAYRLQPLGFASQWADLFRSAEMVPGAVKVKMIGFGAMEQLNPFPLLDSIPFVSQLKDIPATILSALNEALAGFLALPMGAHIERIVLTRDYLELDTDVDLDHPDRSKVFFRFDFRQNEAAGP